MGRVRRQGSELVPHIGSKAERVEELEDTGAVDPVEVLEVVGMLGAGETLWFEATGSLCISTPDSQPNSPIFPTTNTSE
jgi:hypothetical protein